MPCCCWSCWRRPLGHRASRFLGCVQVPACGEGEGERKPGVSALTGVVGAAAGGSGGGEAESRCPCSLRNRVAGLAAAAFQLPVGAVTRPPVSCVPPAQRFGLLPGSGPSHCGQGFRTTGTAFVAPLVLPPPCGPGHPPLDNRCVEFSSILRCGAEAPLLSYEYLTGFTGCRLRGRDKGSVPHPCDADVTFPNGARVKYTG